MAELQAQQEAMLKAAGIGMETVAEAERQNMAFAQQMMQGFYDMENLNEEWTISKAGDGKLDAGQLRLLAFVRPGGMERDMDGRGSDFQCRRNIALW